MYFGRSDISKFKHNCAIIDKLNDIALGLFLITERAFRRPRCCWVAVN